ncbi:hypothetical protein QAD02_006498 [Eretmocerus hayati]|uniref:Uncharacterized protein n=1 Tax=Eretmocerus hayati TaxID=131215 RepID=A0ACC2N1F1_9HYME|nr:hypothetical protein QAD02_006498 [Eretmocerus hayati]
MDQSTRERLVAWNLEAGIDEETFQEIDDCMLELLFDAKEECGHLKRFKSRLAQMRNSQKNNSPKKSKDANISQENSQKNDSPKKNKYANISQENSQKNNSPKKSKDANISQENSHEVANEDENLENIYPESGCRSLNREGSLLDLPIIHSNEPAIIAVGHSSQPLVEIINHQHVPPNASVASPSDTAIDTASSSNDTPMESLNNDQNLWELTPPNAEKVSLKHLLNTTYEGFKIRKPLEEGTLETRMICNLLITHEFNGTKKFSIVKERFEEWTEEIADTLIVPGKTKAQVKAIFYHAFKKATETKKSVDTGGSVYEKYLNERKWLISRGIITKAQVLSEENYEPWSLMIKNWDDSYLIRLPQKDYKEHSILYKGLRTSTIGHRLWSHDYTSKNGTPPNFKIAFEISTPLIVSLAKEKKKLDAADNQLIASNQSYIAALRCLVRFLAKIVTKRDSDGNLSRDGLANIQGAPEIFAFVTINAIDFVVESNSLLDGFDYCYQSFSALGIPYTGECNLVWVFLQRRIYKNNLEDIRDLYRSADKFIETLDQKRSSDLL